MATSGHLYIVNHGDRNNSYQQSCDYLHYIVTFSDIECVIYDDKRDNVCYCCLNGTESCFKPNRCC